MARAGHAYGNTETFTITTGYPANTPPEVHADSFGVALPGVTLKITDPLTGGLVPRGEAGEISVKGPTLMLGYLGTPLDETLDSEGFSPPATAAISTTPADCIGKAGSPTSSRPAAPMSRRARLMRH